MNIKIYIMTHKKFQEPAEPGYTALHVGKALGEDLGYLGDDTGENISDLNGYYGELTGLYWLWQNVHDIDAVGICHYRRYFVNAEGKLMSLSEYEEILNQKEYDLLVSDAVYGKTSVKEGYGQAHNVQDLLVCGEVIKELFPKDYDAFASVIEGNRSYYGNLCVMRKEDFDAYCAWLFGIFAEAGNRIDVSSYDVYHRRVFGFLSETLLQVYLVARNLRPYEGTIGVTAEKAETVEFKLAMTQLVKNRQIKEARQMFYDYQKIRPDIRLGMSDILGEIPDIELILYILEQEQIHQLTNFSSVSDDLKELIRYLRIQKKWLMEKKNIKKLLPEEQEKLKKYPLSEIAEEIIRRNIL